MRLFYTNLLYSRDFLIIFYQIVKEMTLLADLKPLRKQPSGGWAYKIDFLNLRKSLLEKRWLLPTISAGITLPDWTYRLNVGMETSKYSAASCAKNRSSLRCLNRSLCENISSVCIMRRSTKSLFCRHEQSL